MKQNKILKLFFCGLICFYAILHPIITNSTDEQTEIANYESEIKTISELNLKETADSHKNDTENSRLELNYREKEKTTLDFSKYGTELGHIVYPRLKLLKENEEGYKYFLTFQKCYKRSDNTYSSNGDVIYYTRSKDFKEWDEPQILFGVGNDIRNFSFNVFNEKNQCTTLNTQLYYTSCDSCILNDGTIMAVCSAYRRSEYSDYLGMFNKCGLYVKYSTDNGQTWTEARQIYTGICYEPSILQFETGEIQVYFTHEAHIMYMNGEYDKIYTKSLIAHSSEQGQSTGVAMLSSTDYGKTWTPDVKGVEANGVDEFMYNQNIKNPYSAYVISQQTIKENYNKLFNYAQPFYWIGEKKSWENHRGIKVDDDTTIKMGNQMPVAVRLNNGKIVMAMETRETNVEYVEDQEGEYIKNGNGEYVLDDGSNNEAKYKKYVNGFFNVSLGYSEKTPVYTQDGELMYKYWLDLNNNQENMIKVYSDEDDIYSGVGLGGGNGVNIVEGTENDEQELKLYEEGPLEKVEHVFINDAQTDNETDGRAAPYIVQFPSGETVLSYTYNGEKTKINLGDSNGNFTKEGELINKNEISLSAGIWSSLQLLSPNSVAAVIAKKELDVRKIEIDPLYLNHTITAEPLVISSNELNSNVIKWNNNTDCLFLGSMSQAQVTIRVAYDSENVYLMLDRLDYDLTNEDKIEIYLNTDDNNNDYSKIIISYDEVQGCTNAILEKGNIQLSNISYVRNSGDLNERGYKSFVVIPKNELGEIGSKLRLKANLYNKDGDGNTTNDGFQGIKTNDVKTWNKINFVNNAESITLDKMNDVLVKGMKTQLHCNIDYSTSFENTVSDITWTSSNVSVVEVDNMGNLTAIEEGTAIIKAMSADGKSAECEITVKNDIVDVKFNKYPRIEYNNGEELDLKDGILDVTFENGETKQLHMVNEDGKETVNVTGYNSNQFGKQEINIECLKKTISFEVTVLGKLVEINITTEPTKTQYKEGESFEPEGMIVTATYDNGTTKEVTEYTVTDGNNLLAGKKAVTISYTENGVTKTTTQGITVEEQQLEIIFYTVKETQKDGVKYIENIHPSTKIEEILEKIETNGEIEIYKGTRKIEDANIELATGMKLKIHTYSKSIEYTLVVTGDLNGDGKMGDIDLLKLARYKAELDKTLQGEYLQAANIYRDDNIADDIDLLKMARILAGLDTL